MKTFMTVSIDRKDLMKDELKSPIDVKIKQVTHATLALMRKNHLVQLKITNLPPLKEDT